MTQAHAIMTQNFCDWIVLKPARTLKHQYCWKGPGMWSARYRVRIGQVMN